MKLLNFPFKLGIFSLCVAGILWFFFSTDNGVETNMCYALEWQAGSAAQKFTGEELDDIHDKNDMGTELFHSLVLRTKTIKENIPYISYVYIMRKTDDPMQLMFIIEDDMLDSLHMLDINQNGKIDDDEVSVVPGDLYDISNIPAMQEEAFTEPTVDKEKNSDQWGTWISSYAPIYRNDGSVAGIIGLDVSADEFASATRSAMTPWLIFFVVLGFVFMGAGYAMRD